MENKPMSTGPKEGSKGTVEGLKGKAKEVAGDLLDNRDLEREGEAQQDKARAQRVKRPERKREADVALAGESGHPRS